MDKKNPWVRFLVLGGYSAVIGAGIVWWNWDAFHEPAGIVDRSGSEASKGWVFDASDDLGEPLFPSLSLFESGREFRLECDPTADTVGVRLSYSAELTGDAQAWGEWPEEVEKPLLNTPSGPIRFESYNLSEPNDSDLFTAYYWGIDFAGLVGAVETGATVQVEVVGEPNLGGRMPMDNLRDGLPKLVDACRTIARQDREQEFMETKGGR